MVRGGVSNEFSTSQIMKKAKEDYINIQVSNGVSREEAALNYEDMIIKQAQDNSALVNVGLNTNVYYKPNERLIFLEGGK